MADDLRVVVPDEPPETPRGGWTLKNWTSVEVSGGEVTIGHLWPEGDTDG